MLIVAWLIGESFAVGMHQPTAGALTQKRQLEEAESLFSAEGRKAYEK